MIQDIAPHRLDRSYSLAPAAPSDFALCYREGKALLRREGEGYALPRFEELGTETGDARYLFALDGTGCYLAPAPEEAPDDCVYLSTPELRQARPMETAFAAFTGAQLNRWYRDRTYCGRCGHLMEPSRIERAMVCPRCGLTEYPKLCPVVIVAVKAGDRLLLTRSRLRPTGNDALISGYVEIGETLEDTVRREVMEEAGVRVKNIRYYKSQPWAMTDTQLSGFYCDLDGDDALTVDTSELTDAYWRRREEITPRDGDISLTAEMIERFRRGEE
ncbi:MAG: NAD(+) diphosphatase [Ruminococcaceae bacterium]|nr:NAD(+) diphosphatase [Oscillospiraceae bacterium]